MFKSALLTVIISQYSRLRIPWETARLGSSTAPRTTCFRQTYGRRSTIPGCSSRFVKAYIHFAPELLLCDRAYRLSLHNDLKPLHEVQRLVYRYALMVSAVYENVKGDKAGKSLRMQKTR